MIEITGEQVVTVLTALTPIAGAWALVQHRTKSHSQDIKQLKATVTRLRLRYAVLKTKVDPFEDRLKEGLEGVQQAIAQMEARVTRHVDDLVETFTSNKG
jgi:phage shock protein A